MDSFDLRAERGITKGFTLMYFSSICHKVWICARLGRLVVFRPKSL